MAACNRTEDVQSPAYSDISDDSAPVVDASDLGIIKFAVSLEQYLFIIIIFNR